jgi:hypothetical protein
MTLQVSGAISLSDVNTEIRVSSTATISLNDAAVRTLFARASGAIALSNGYGKQYRASVPLTYSSSGTNVSTDVSAIPGYIAGISDIVITINSGVVFNSNNTGVAAWTITGGALGDTITVNNAGTVYGAGGSNGANGGGDGNPNATWAVGNPPTTLSPATSSFVNGTYPNIRGNYSGALYYQGPGRGANWPDYNYYSGGTGPANGSPGGNGGPALALNCNCALIINNSGLLVGGGGGGGGQAGNNRGGGAGGSGGYAMIYSGSHPVATVNNLSGGILASGGGGAGGWGNRYEGEGHGGDYGQAGTSYHWTGAGSSPGGSLGLAPNNTGVTLINTVGTFTVSPAV